MKLLMIALLAGSLFCSCASMKQKEQTKTTGNSTEQSLSGNWELNLLPVADSVFNALYAEKKPTISFDLNSNKYNGNTGCNNYNGALAAGNGKISFKETMAMTRMACRGEGESVFLENLKKVNRYSISADGKTLTFIQGDIALMRFNKN